MFDSTFITLHRKIINSACFDDAELLKVWIWCLVRANHKDREIVHAGQVIKLKRGDFITGRFEATKELKTTTMKFRGRIALLEQLGQITRKVTNKYTIISVVNYDYYQGKDKKVTNKQPTNNQQTTTDNNVNNVNNKLSETSSLPLKENNKNDMGFNKYADDFEEELQIDPDHKPKGKEKKKVADEIQQVFDLFDNPARPLWRLREIERVAAQALFDAYGLETLQKRVQRIEAEKKINGDDPYFPLVTTPSQLLDKMEAVERYLKI